MKTFYTNSIKGLTLLFLLFLSSKGSNAQMVTDFVSKGKIPAVFTKTLESKVLKAYETIDSKLSSTELKAKKNELYREEFYKDYLLKSGLIVFNDDLSNYATRIVNELLKDDIAFKNSLQIYTAKSSIINAICLEDNIIIITTGMFAKLESESELAFILANKIAHLKNKSYSKIDFASFALPFYMGLFSAFNISEYLKAVHPINDELKADAEAIKMISTSKYASSEIINALNMLEFSHHSVSFDKLNLKPLETKHLKIPTYYLDVDVKPIELNNPNNDIHFKVDDRIIAAKELIRKEEGKNKGVLNIQSKKELEKVQAIAEIENIIDLTCRGLNYESLYLNLTALSKKPNDFKLKKCLAFNLNNISLIAHRFKNLDKEVAKRHEGRRCESLNSESQRLCEFIARIGEESIMTIAAAKLYELHLEYPNEKIFTNHLENIFGMLNYDFGRDLDYYGNKHQWSKSTNKIKREEGDSSVGNQCKYVFRDVVESKNFKQYFEKGISDFNLKEEERKLKVEQADFFLSEYEKHEVEERIEEFNEKNKEKVEITKIAIYQPLFLYDVAEDEKSGEFVEDFYKQARLKERLLEKADKKKVNYTFISSDNLEPNDIDAWNNYAAISLMFNFYFINKSFYDFFDMNAQLAKRLDVDQLLFTYILAKGAHSPTIERNSKQIKYYGNIFDLKSSSVIHEENIHFTVNNVKAAHFIYYVNPIVKTIKKAKLYRFK